MTTNRNYRTVVWAASMAMISVYGLVGTASADYITELQATPGIVNYWGFEEPKPALTVVDLVGSDDATHSSSFMNNVAGPRPTDGFANMAAGNNTRDYNNAVHQTKSISAATAANGSSAITVSLWYKLDQTGSNTTRQILFGYQQATSPRYNLVAARSTTNKMRFFVKDSDGDAFSVDVDAYQAAVDDSLWHNLVFSWDGSQLATYLDGGNKQTFSSGGVSGGLAISDALVIGGDINNANGFDGSLDEIAVFTRVLGDAEVSFLYQAALVVPEPATLGLLSIGCMLMLKRK